MLNSLALSYALAIHNHPALAIHWLKQYIRMDSSLHEASQTDSNGEHDSELEPAAQTLEPPQSEILDEAATRLAAVEEDLSAISRARETSQGSVPGLLTGYESVLDAGSTASMEDEYVYEPLKENQIRLLEVISGTPSDPISCRLVHVDLNNAPKYRGVSYTWGEDESCTQILVDRKRLSIRPNLEAALREFRRDPPWAIPEAGLSRLTAAIESLDTITESCHNNVESRHLSDESAREFVELWQWLQSKLPELKLAVDKANENVDASDPEADWQKVNTFGGELAEELEERWKTIACREGLHLVHHESCLLWIDAICINQRDLEERSRQVQLMDLIYLKATSVVIWLGDETPSSKVALATLSRYLEDHQRGDQTVVHWIASNAPFEDKTYSISCVLELMTRPWFSRCWTVQEYVLARLDSYDFHRHGVIENDGDVIVCCGPARFPCLIERLFGPARSSRLFDQGDLWIAQGIEKGLSRR